MPAVPGRKEDMSLTTTTTAFLRNSLFQHNVGCTLFPLTTRRRSDDLTDMKKVVVIHGVSVIGDEKHVRSAAAAATRYFLIKRLASCLSRLHAAAESNSAVRLIEIFPRRRPPAAKERSLAGCPNQKERSISCSRGTAVDWRGTWS